MDLPAIALLAGLAAYTPVSVPTPTSSSPKSVLAAAGRVVVSSPSGLPIAWDSLIRSLLFTRIIALGEKHDETSHHLIQADVLSALADQDPSVTVGLEMISQDLQPSLDSFLSGSMSEPDFAAFWKKAWGFDYAIYKPVFDVARARRLRVVGLNAPIAVVVSVAKKGLAALTPAERALLPASIAESSDARYRAYVKDSLAGHKLPPEAEARMTEAQSVWNETMGAKVAELARDSRVVVIAGEGHMFWRAGIPESAARRGAGPAVVILPSSSAPTPDELPTADDFVLTR